MFRSFLPAPTQPIWDRDEERRKLQSENVDENGPRSESRALVSAQRTAPPYGKRKGWIPRSVDDFGDGSSSIAGFQTHVHQRRVGFEPVQKHQGGIEGGHRL